MEEIELETEDLQAALKELHQYVDITEEDLKTIYAVAVRYAKKRLALRVLVSDVMTRDVITVKRDVEVQAAARLLSENRISGMPVVDEGNHVIGVVTEADILCSAGIKRGHTFKDLLRQVLGGPVPQCRKGETVEDIMTSPAITARHEDDLKKIARILDEKRIKRVPVVDHENRLQGIISRAILVRLMGQQ